MMKNLKIFLLSFALIAGFLTSCSNNESVVEEQNIDESEAITQSLNRLAQQFNAEGNVIASANPSGNIVFDFCFDFVYPLNLSYNNGTTVSVNSLDDLITILINSTDDLYISGVEFPFDIEMFNGNTDAIEIVTINNEDEFFDVLEDCDFDAIDDCNCTLEYAPVCVEVQAPDGVNFIVTYPNACAAECDGFTPDDFVENCANDGNNTGGFECFEFNFPLTITTDDNQTITVNSQEELDNALYNTYYFDFVYSFDVTLNGETLTIGNEEAFIALLEDCFDDNEGCPIDANFLEETLLVCDSYEVEIYDLNGNIVDINYVSFHQNGELIVNGTPTVTDTGSWDITNSNDNLSIVISNLPTFTLLNGNWELENCSDEHLEFTNDTYVIYVNLECEINNPNYCTEQELFDYLLECDWYINTSLYNNVNAEYAQFSQDGSLEIISQGSTSGINGTWDLSSNPSTAQLYMSFNVNNIPNSLFNELDWSVTQCSENYIVLESGDEFIQLERDCNNNGSDCTDEVTNLLTQCSWALGGYQYVFNSEGTLTISGNGVATTGQWLIGSTSPTSIFILEELNDFNDEWIFEGCGENGILEISSTANPNSAIETDCD